MKKFLFLVTAAILNGGGGGGGCQTQFWKGPTLPGLVYLDSAVSENKILSVIVYQNMPNLHNRYKSAERKNSQKNPEYMLNYSFPCSCSKHLSSFRFIIKQQWIIEEISIFSNSSHLWRAGMSDTILRDQPKDHPCQVWFNLVQGFQRRRFKCESLRCTTTDAKWWQKLTWPLARWAKNTIITIYPLWSIVWKPVRLHLFKPIPSCILCQECLLKILPFSTIFQLYGGGNWSTRRKPPTCRKSLTNLITQYCIKYTPPWAGFELTTLLVVIAIDCTCIGRCKSNYLVTMPLQNKNT